MATIAWPTSRLVQPQTLAWGEVRKIRGSGEPPLGGDEQMSEVAYSHRWKADILLPPTPSFAERAFQEAWISRLRSGSNRTTFHHFQHPIPYGTLRGSNVNAGTYPQGSTAIEITATNGQTLKAGDMIGITTTAAYAVQVVRVIGDYVAAANAISFQFEPALRAQATIGLPVVWDRPAALFRLMEAEWMQTSSARNAQPISLTFKEVLA